MCGRPALTLLLMLGKCPATIFGYENLDFENSSIADTSSIAELLCRPKSPSEFANKSS